MPNASPSAVLIEGAVWTLANLPSISFFDPDYLYAESQGGYVGRVHRWTHQARNIQPTPRAGEKLRFNWNAALHPSPSEPGTIYFGAQFLFRSRDRGDSWERLSPDLTTNDPKRQRQRESGGLTIDNSTAENNATISTIAASPHDRDLIWVGTDDGNVQVTRDGGATWANVRAALKGVPAGLWCSRVEASRFEEGTCYANFDGHRSDARLCLQDRGLRQDLDSDRGRHPELPLDRAEACGGNCAVLGLQVLRMLAHPGQ